MGRAMHEVKRPGKCWETITLADMKVTKLDKIYIIRGATIYRNGNFYRKKDHREIEARRRGRYDPQQLGNKKFIKKVYRKKA